MNSASKLTAIRAAIGPVRLPEFVQVPAADDQPETLKPLEAATVADLEAAIAGLRERIAATRAEVAAWRELDKKDTREIRAVIGPDAPLDTIVFICARLRGRLMTLGNEADVLTAIRDVARKAGAADADVAADALLAASGK